MSKVAAWVLRKRLEHWARPAHRYGEAECFHRMPDAPAATDGDAAAAQLAAIKLAHARQLPVDAMPKDTLSGLLRGKVSMGPPKRPPSTGKRGRPSKKTQYDDAFGRRQKIGLVELFRQTETARRIGRAASYLSNETLARIVREVVNDPAVPERKKNSEIRRRYERVTGMQGNQPTQRTVSRYLAQLRKAGGAS